MFTCFIISLRKGQIFANASINDIAEFAEQAALNVVSGRSVLKGAEYVHAV